jgi:hypothetical protein
MKAVQNAGKSKVEGLPPDFLLISCLDYSSLLKMEATYSSETSVDSQRIA